MFDRTLIVHAADDTVYKFYKSAFLSARNKATSDNLVLPIIWCPRVYVWNFHEYNELEGSRIDFHQLCLFHAQFCKNFMTSARIRQHCNVGRPKYRNLSVYDRWRMFESSLVARLCTFSMETASFLAHLSRRLIFLI